MKKLCCIIAACALTISASISHAGVYASGGVYSRGGVYADGYAGDYSRGYIGASIGLSDIDVRGFDEGSSVSISGGLRINRNFALEVSYIDLGELDDNFIPVWTVGVDGINFAAVVIFPASQQVDIFAKLGMYKWDFSLSEEGAGEIYSETGTDLSLGFGAAINIAPQFAVVFEYQQFDVDDEDLSNISLGIRVNF